ncbi:hypothetical protein Y032_0582g288 [Ancylostoma ceylanicum]|uniref:Secreted protein n=1 Tax=Ancylostoma ceylanicum TaxID=53326 RepID=A0A016WMS7_9BILA|nr:hypothetical protein Y032_0582g288 [Ancylostoma ceylanicum]
MCFLLNDSGWMLLVAIVLRLVLTANGQHFAPHGRAVGQLPIIYDEKELKCIGHYNIQTTMLKVATVEVH